MRSPHKTGFTLIEVLVMIAIIGILIALLLPAVHTACGVIDSEGHYRLRTVPHGYSAPDRTDLECDVQPREKEPEIDLHCGNASK